MSASTSADADVVIVGAGLAGATAAAVLAQKAVRVVLIDPRKNYPGCFKSEKIYESQIELFRKFGLMDGLRSVASPIHQVTYVRGPECIRRLRVEQYGISYEDLVNGVRCQIPLSVAWKTCCVRDIDLGSDVSRVRLVNGETVTARLCVFACGTGGNIHAGLGIEKRTIRKGQSFIIGFNIAKDNGRPFPFEALKYHPLATNDRVAFLNLFPIRDVMRANLAVYRLPNEEWVTQFKQKPHEVLLSMLPGLVRFTGSFHIASKVEMCPIDLYSVREHVRPGLVLIGDCYRNVCPTSGMGVTKILTDVDCLGRCVPEWLQTSGMGIDKISSFYEDRRKCMCDERAIRLAQNWRELSTSTSCLWHLRRELRYQIMRCAGALKDR